MYSTHHPLGGPDEDLFTTAQNAKCQNFTSRFPQSMGNALWINRAGIFAYAFPLLPLLLYVTWKLQQTSLTLILLAPTWAIQPWFSSLLNKCVVPHKKLPSRLEFLTRNQGRIRHPNSRQLNLAIRLLRSLRFGISIFLKNAWPSSKKHAGPLRVFVMLPSGKGLPITAFSSSWTLLNLRFRILYCFVTSSTCKN